jgi:hypothetical protein
LLQGFDPHPPGLKTALSADVSERIQGGPVDGNGWLAICPLLQSVDGAGNEGKYPYQWGKACIRVQVLPNRQDKAGPLSYSLSYITLLE